MTPKSVPNLDQIAREILHYEDLAIKYTEDSIKFRVEIGRRLQKAKDALPHGKFLPWVKRYFPHDRSYACKHMQLARNVERVKHLPPNAGIRMALQVISPPRAQSLPATKHPRLVVALDSGVEAVLEIKRGDFGQVCDTLRARNLSFRLELPKKKAIAA